MVDNMRFKAITVGPSSHPFVTRGRAVASSLPLGSRRTNCWLPLHGCLRRCETFLGLRRSKLMPTFGSPPNLCTYDIPVGNQDRGWVCWLWKELCTNNINVPGLKWSATPLITPKKQLNCRINTLTVDKHVSTQYKIYITQQNTFPWSSSRSAKLHPLHAKPHVLYRIIFPSGFLSALSMSVLLPSDVVKVC